MGLGTWPFGSGHSRQVNSALYAWVRGRAESGAWRKFWVPCTLCVGGVGGICVPYAPPRSPGGYMGKTETLKSLKMGGITQEIFTHIVSP